MITISKDAWHYKLLVYVWDINPSVYKNLCPYFWLTIASIVLFPFVFVYRTIRNIISTISRYINKIIDDSLEHDFITYLNKFSANDILYLDNNKNGDYDVWKNMPKTFKKSYTVSDMVSKWKKINNIDVLTYNKLLTSDEYVSYAKKKNKEYFDKLNREIKEHAEKNEISLKKKEKLNKIIKYTKRIFGLLITLLLTGIGILLSLMFTYMLTGLIQLLITYSSEVVISLKVIVVLILLCVISSIYYKFIRNKFQRFINRDETSLKEKLLILPFLLVWSVYKLLYYIFYKFLWVCVIVSTFKAFRTFIFEFTDIFGEYFGASYSDYCPGISWDSEEENK